MRERSFLLLLQVLLQAVGCSRGLTVTAVTLPDGTTLLGRNSSLSSSSSSYVCEFLGVPYATPPVGTLRWAPPQPWVNPNTSEAINATDYGSACTQRKHGNMYGSEDCLYLNVFVHAKHFPLQAGLALPVAFWIHGGTYIGGDGSQYDAKELIEFFGGDVIIVTINYRLNIFGFLGSDEMRSLDPHNSTGLLGLLDQRLAMKWVQSSISAFGGDKNNVTLFGQSAGAGSISCHLSMPKSHGLFAAVAQESGAFSPWIVQNMSDSEKAFQAVLVETGCSDLSCLQNKTTEELYATAQNIDPSSALLPSAFLPSVDFVELISHPWIVVAEGNVSNVPILLGTNADEGVSYLPSNIPSDMNAIEFQVALALTGFLDYHSKIVSMYITDKQYPEVFDESGVKYSDYWWASQRFVGDYFFSCPVQHALNQLSPASLPNCYDSSEVYCKQLYAYHNQYSLQKLGKFVEHGFELPLVWHFEEYLTTAKDVSMADHVASYWGSFIVSQSPNNSQSGVMRHNWEPYDPSTASIITFFNDSTVQYSVQLKKAECDFMIDLLDEEIRKSYPGLPQSSSEASSSGDARMLVITVVVVVAAGLIIGGIAACLWRRSARHANSKSFAMVEVQSD